MVQIQSKQERSMWASAALNSVPDIAIAWIASDYFGIGPIGFVAAFFGLQILYTLLWLKRIAWSWLLYWIAERKKMTEHLENFLYQQRFPQPPDFVTGIDDYLAKIANDNRGSPPLRVKAATELGVLAGIRAGGNLLYTMQLSMAYEGALEKYSLRFPPREYDDDQPD